MLRRKRKPITSIYHFFGSTSHPILGLVSLVGTKTGYTLGSNLNYQHNSGISSLFVWSRITAAIENVWAQGWDALATARENGALPAEFFLGQRYADLRLKEMGELAGVLEYRAVNAAIARFEKRLKIDRELRKNNKKVAKELNIEI